MRLYYTKHTLYKEIEKLRRYLGLQYSSFPISSINICNQTRQIAVQSIDFKTRGLQGMLYLAKSEDERDVILLNDHQDKYERNFYCMHELIHSALHRDEAKKSFNCFDVIPDKQDLRLEWQANEGAAEFLAPHYDFIPTFCNEFDRLSQSPGKMYLLVWTLAEKYGVTTKFVVNRIDTLRYEIDQYRNGVSINDLTILSKAKQDFFNIPSTDYASICCVPFDFDDIVNFG